MTPYTERQKTLLVNNIVGACKFGIERLNKASYNYLYLCSGFIAHYNHCGFIAHYGDGDTLMEDILDNKRYNQWSNFGPNDRDYEYYMSKRDVYNKIVKELEACYA